MSLPLETNLESMMDGFNPTVNLMESSSKASNLNKKTCTEGELLGGGGFGILKSSEIGIKRWSHTNLSCKPHQSYRDFGWKRDSNDRSVCYLGQFPTCCILFNIEISFLSLFNCNFPR